MDDIDNEIINSFDRDFNKLRDIIKALGGYESVKSKVRAYYYDPSSVIKTENMLMASLFSLCGSVGGLLHIQKAANCEELLPFLGAAYPEEIVTIKFINILLCDTVIDQSISSKTKKEDKAWCRKEDKDIEAWLKDEGLAGRIDAEGPKKKGRGLDLPDDMPEELKDILRKLEMMKDIVDLRRIDDDEDEEDDEDKK